MIKNYSKNLLAIFAILLVSQATFAQTKTDVETAEIPKAILIDELSNILGSEDRSARLDAFYIELQNVPKSSGVIVFFCGKVCHYGEFEAHIRGIHQKINLRGFDLSKISIIFGGYKKEGQIRLWLVPENAGLPIPKSDLKFEEVKFKKKYKKTEFYDCCFSEQ